MHSQGLILLDSLVRGHDGMSSSDQLRGRCCYGLRKHVHLGSVAVFHYHSVYKWVLKESGALSTALKLHMRQAGLRVIAPSYGLGISE